MFITRRHALKLIGSVFVSGPAAAQVPGTFQPLLLGPTPAATISYRTTAGSSGTTPSFAAIDIGTADSTRRVIVGVSWFGVVSLNSMTIGGIAATKSVTRINSASQTAEIWIAAVPTGATATIALTFSGSTTRVQIGVWAAYNLLSSTATATASADSSTTINIVADGIAVAESFANDSGATPTWAGVTQDYLTAINGAAASSGASKAFATTQTGLTVSSSWSPSLNPNLVVAAYR